MGMLIVGLVVCAACVYACAFGIIQGNIDFASTGDILAIVALLLVGFGVCILGFVVNKYVDHNDGCNSKILSIILCPLIVALFLVLHLLYLIVYGLLYLPFISPYEKDPPKNILLIPLKGLCILPFSLIVLFSQVITIPFTLVLALCDFYPNVFKNELSFFPAIKSTIKEWVFKSL